MSFFVSQLPLSFFRRGGISGSLCPSFPWQQPVLIDQVYFKVFKATEVPFSTLKTLALMASPPPVSLVVASGASTLIDPPLLTSNVAAWQVAAKKMSCRYVYKRKVQIFSQQLFNVALTCTRNIIVAE